MYLCGGHFTKWNLIFFQLMSFCKATAFEFIHVGINNTHDDSVHNCDTDKRLLEAKPCFAGHVETQIQAEVGDTIELRCFIFNINTDTTIVSLIVLTLLIV